MAEHTPTPWRIYKQPIKNADEAKLELSKQVNLTDPIGDTLFLLEAGGKCPATTGCGPTSEANAAHIIKCVNSHDALVKALETLLEEAESFSVSGVYFSEECMGHKGPKLARAALAQVQP